MARLWFDLLSQAGLNIDWSEAAWCTTAQDNLLGSIAVSGTTAMRRKREEGFEALGVWINLDGHFTEEIADAAAWRRFFTLRHMLCNNNVALITDCDCLSHVFCRLLTRTQCTHLRAVQDHMLRKMIYVPRCPEESSESHMARWSRLLRHCRSKHKILHGDETYFAQYFSWCGHIARLVTRDPARETSNMFLKKHDVASQFEEGVGHTMSWPAFFGSGDGNKPWHNVLAIIGPTRHKATLGGEQS